MTLLVYNRVERGRYLDSVALMHVSRSLGALPGVDAAAAMIGTPSNRRLLAEAGLLASEGESATPNDLIIAVRGTSERAALDALAAAGGLLVQPAQASDEALAHARSLGAALELSPQANLALVSVPGEFAALEARKALGRGLNVLIFSDNVPIEDEVDLKHLAAARRLLVMGPDCGTALIAGTPIAFANVVPRGDIGIVSASGTGLQEVSTLIARLGGGVSHGIGVGGRDLDARVGALGTLGALDALEADPGTQTIVLISKPPAPAVAKKVLARIAKSPKKCIVCFLGSDEPGLARTLTAAAEQAVGKKLPAMALKLPKPKKGKIRGLFCGGTLCAEAEVIFKQKKLKNYELVDLGDYQYTRGRPHPMIEPELRNPHVARALADDKVAALLVDVVLGFGSHPDPASVLAKALKGARKPVIASVTGTEADPQVLSRQIATLRDAGVFVASSNARAAEAATAVVAARK